jgi:hypothetical protein
VVLRHEGEVTGVDWCGGEWGRLATCGHGCAVRVWELARSPDREDGGAAEVAEAMGAQPAALTAHVELASPLPAAATPAGTRARARG